MKKTITLLLFIITTTIVNAQIYAKPISIIDEFGKPLINKFAEDGNRIMKFVNDDSIMIFKFTTVKSEEFVTQYVLIKEYSADLYIYQIDVLSKQNKYLGDNIWEDKTDKNIHYSLTSNDKLITVHCWLNNN
jgi:hypothetical protein